MRRSVRQFKEENVGRRGASGISGNGTASTRLSNARKLRGAASVDVDGVANVEIAKIGVRRRAISGKNASALNFVSSDRKRLRIKSRKPETPRGASVAFQRFERRVDDKRTPCRLDLNGKNSKSDKSDCEGGEGTANEGSRRRIYSDERPTRCSTSFVFL